MNAMERHSRIGLGSCELGPEPGEALIPPGPTQVVPT
jgi:hypothetical protein